MTHFGLCRSAYPGGRETLAVLVTGLAAACAAGAQPQPAESPALVQIPVASTAPAAGTTRVPEPSSDAAAPEDPSPKLVRACEGSALDLRWVHESHACVVPSGAPAEFPAEVLQALEPAEVSAVSGDTVRFDLVMRNTADRVTPVGIRTACSIAGARVSIHSKDGQRVDVVHRCGFGIGCGGSASVIFLAPGGDARMTLDVSATQRLENDDCELGDPRPLAPGEYVLRVETPFGGPTAEAVLTVKARQ